MDSAPVSNDVKNREVDFQSLPISYPYRDDALCFYETIGHFVSNIINIYYKTDEDFKNDKSLRLWFQLLQDTTEPTAPSLNYDGVKRFPDFPNTKNELADILTAIIWSASGQHSAVNNGQFDYYGFVPNGPLLHRKPVPLPDQEIDQQYIFDSLPSLEQSLQQIGFMHLLTTENIIYTDTFIPKMLEDQENYLEKIYGFSNSGAIKKVTEFTESLKKLETIIEKQQARRIKEFRKNVKPSSTIIPLTVVYPYLQPNRTNLSINN